MHLKELIEQWLPPEFDHVSIWDSQIICTDHSGTAASIQMIGSIQEDGVVLLQKEYVGWSFRTPLVLPAADPDFFKKLYKGLEREQHIMVHGEYVSPDLGFKHTK